MPKLVVLALFSTEIFFSIFSILNKSYLGSDGLSIFSLVKVVILLLILCLFVKKRKGVLNVKEAFIFLFIVIFMICLLATVIKYNYLNSKFFNSTLIFCTYSIVGIISGILLRKKDKLLKVIDYFDSVTIFITIGLLAAILSQVLNGNISLERNSFGGSNYQVASYTAAVCFLFNIYFIVSGYKVKIRMFHFYICRLFLLCIQLICLITFGGRGGLVLLVVGVIYILIFNINKIKFHKILIILFLMSITLIGIFHDSPFLVNGFNRIISFITSDGISWSNTAGRDLIYLEAIDLIKQSPFIGYGIGSSYYITSYGIYPHNFFLEILIDGGIIYIIFWIAYLSYIIYRMFKMIKLDRNLYFLGLVFIVGFIPLMFSYSYWSGNPIFWMIITYLFIGEIKPNKDLVC